MCDGLCLFSFSWNMRRLLAIVLDGGLFLWVLLTSFKERDVPLPVGSPGVGILHTH